MKMDPGIDGNERAHRDAVTLALTWHWLACTNLDFDPEDENVVTDL
jgi:hypothetical protein